MELTNFWLLLFWMFTGGILLAVVFPKRKEIVMGKLELRWNVFPAIMLVIPYIIWSGFRSDGYGDTAIYRKNFLQAPDQLSQLGSYLSEISKDKGFSFLTVIVKTVIGNSDVIFFLLIAMCEMLALALVFRKYSCNYWMSIFIFVASTEYISWLHNGIRQFLAVALIVFATELLLEKKYVPLICVIIIAATFHASALLMLPMVFIVQGKAWNKKTVLCILASVAVLFVADKFTNVLDLLMSNTQYSNMVSDWKEWGDNGTNPIRVLVYSIPMILSIIGYRQIKYEDDNFVNILVNFSILTSAIALISMVTSGIFIGRLIIFPGVYPHGQEETQKKLHKLTL